MQFPLCRKLILVTFIAAQVNYVQGAGYGLNEQSASYFGTGFAGRTSNVIDAAISSTNPGGISFLSGRQLSAGTDFIMEGGKFHGKYKGPIETIEGDTKNFQQKVFVPFGYFTAAVNDKWSLGVCGYAPFGVELKYDNNWPGDYFSNKTSVRVINLQGTASYLLTDDLSVGLGLIGSYVKGTLTQKTWLLPAALAADVRVEGDDYTYGWNLGTVWKARESTTLGLAYHSQLDFTLKGDFSLAGIPPRMKRKILPASLKITMPERMLAGITHRFDNRWTAMADVTWTRWSRFKAFNITTPEPSAGAYVPMNWNNTWALSLGTSYQLNEQWLLRAGYMFDESPVKDNNRTVRSPDASRNWFTLGANWQAAKGVSVDAVYSYVRQQKGKVNEGKYNMSGQKIPGYGYIAGEYDNDTQIVGVQINYIF